MFAIGNHQLIQTSFANMPINSRQKRLKANTIPEDVIIDAYQVILREETIRVANKKLKTKNMNSQNTKLQWVKIQRNLAKKLHIIVIKKN